MRRKSSRSKGKPSNRRDSWEDKESRDMKRDTKKRSSARNRDRIEASDGSTNDPRWYAADPALLRDSASIPFAWPIGHAIDTGLEITTGATSLPTSMKKRNFPGIMALRMIPTFGANLDSDAINVSAAATYSFVRHTNAGHANYDPNDLMLYIIGMTQVYSYINYLERIYALAMTYDQRNRYLPDSVLRAMRVDPDSIKSNLADFRYRINVYINKVSSLAVPATMTVYLRQAMLYAFVYAEGESVKDQLYMYYPDGFYHFALDDDSAGCLVYEQLTPNYDSETLLTYQDLITYGTNMFNKIWEQEDFGIMSGDIIKSYGSNILSLSSLDEVVPFSPVFDPMVLHQIKNATVLSRGYFNRATAGIFQNDSKSRLDVVVETPSFNNIRDVACAEYMLRGNKILTLDTADPTPEMVIEATRLMVGWNSTIKEGSNYIINIACPTECVMECTIYTLDISDYSVLHYTPLIGCYYASISRLTTPALIQERLEDDITRFSMAKAFKYAPSESLIVFTADTDTAPHNAFTSFEVDNFAVLSNDDIKKQHTAALLNMLNVPSAAKNVRV